MGKLKELRERFCLWLAENYDKALHERVGLEISFFTATFVVMVGGFDKYLGAALGWFVGYAVTMLKEYLVDQKLFGGHGDEKDIFAGAIGAAEGTLLFTLIALLS